MAKYMDVRRTKIQFIRYAVDTGERPILCTGVDNLLYWCKNFDESTNGETIVNELVSYEVGRAIDAPVPSWTIMDPGDYAGELVHSENGSPLTVVSRKPLFGSQHIHGTVASDDLMYIKRNSNPDRIPRLVALWYLCNARDIQMLYQPERKYSIYSIDHGYWFSSQEGSRNIIDSPDSLDGTPHDIPHLRGNIGKDNWDNAIKSVRDLSKQSLGHIPACIPDEWDQGGVAQEMFDYILSRVEYTVNKLEEAKAKGF